MFRTGYITLLTSVLVVLLVGLFIFLADRLPAASSLENAVRQYVAGVYARDYAKAYEHGRPPQPSL